MPEIIVSLEGVSRDYDDGRVVALREVSLEIARGETLAIVGPSGSGKSTLLHLLCGLDRPSLGRVRFLQRTPATATEWARLRARHVGFVFQAFHLLPTLTALENVEAPMLGVVAGAAARRRRAQELLARVGLAERQQHRPGTLSGGERQRVAIARAIANGPQLILADEPTGNLDSAAAAQVLALLYEIHAREGASLVLVTHDHGIAARAGRRIHIADGRIAA